MRHPPDPMGSVQTKLDSLRAESSGSFGMNSSSDAAGRRDRRHSPPMFVASTSSRATLDEEDASYRTGTSNHGKRAATQERLETKRSKLANEVPAPKPSLLVRLKLTQYKLSDGSTESSENPQKVIQGVHTSDPRLFGSKQSPIMRGGPGNNMGPAPGGSRSRMYQETRENVDGPTASDVSGSFGARGPAAFAERPNTQTQNQTYRANQTPAATPDPLPTTAPQEDDDSSLLREPQSETLRTVAEAAIEATKISSMGRHRLEVQTPTRQHRNASEPQSSAAHDEYHRGDPTGADSTEKGDDSSSAAHPSTTGASIPQTGLSEDSGQGHAPIQRNQEATGQAVTAGVEHFEMDENLSKKWLAIYLSDQAQMHSAIIPPGELRTKESMFAAIDEELQDDIGPDEAVVAIKITRVDGGAFEGTGIIPMIPVKKRGASLTWDILARFISRNGAGEGGLKGVVNVQKVNVDTRSG